MWRDLHRAQFVDEVLHVISLVGPERDRSRPISARLNHLQRRNPLGVPISLRQAGIDEKTVAVLHQAMAHEAEFGFLARPLAVKPGIRIGCRGMRLIRPSLAVEVRVRIATTPVNGRRARTVLRLDALH